MGDALELEVHRGLGPANRLHGPAGQAVAECVDARVEFRGGHGVIDEPHLRRLRRRDQVACHQVFLGAGEADQLRPDHAAAVAGDQADLDVRIAYAGRIGGEDDVAQQRDGSAEADRRTIDLCDHRLLDVEQREDDALGVGRLAVELGRVGDAFLDARKVAARREGAAGAGQYDHVGGFVGRGEPQRIDEFDVHCGGEGVEHLRPVEGDGEDAAPPRQHKGREFGNDAHAVPHRLANSCVMFAALPPILARSSLAR